MHSSRDRKIFGILNNIKEILWVEQSEQEIEEKEIQLERLWKADHF